jgi:beta-glucanase (GH16 family)
MPLLRYLRLPRVQRGAAAVAVAAVLVLIGFTRLASAGSEIVWSDDFDGPTGSAPDSAKWVHEVGGSGFGNNELEYYTDKTTNAALDGEGHLVITARRENPAGYGCWYGSCQYTSARLTTAGTFSQAYGRVEARIKIPTGRGLWPAFWMMGNNFDSVGWPANGEMDIMEVIGSEPNLVHGNLHGPGYSGGNSLGDSYDLGRSLADDFHTFAVDWAPDSIAFSVDDHEYSRHTPADTGGNPWVFNHDFFLILNVAVGGHWPGPPGDATVFPQQMVIDYVRVFAPGSDRPASSGPTATAGTARTTPSTTPTGKPVNRHPTNRVPASGTGFITGYGGKCVDVAAAGRADGTQVQLFRCNGTAAQRLRRSGDTIRVLGKCLDVSGAGTANGTRVQLWHCNGTGAQKWIYRNDEIVNTNSGKCLDARGPSSQDWTPLQIWECHGGHNQAWILYGGLDTLAGAEHPSTIPSVPEPSGTAPAGDFARTQRIAAMAAAPYLYLGWGSPPDPRSVMSATGIRWFTMAFILSDGGCNPRWDGQRPLTGGPDQTAINAIRSAGGDVVVSFGGAAGPSLESTCGSASALAAAYRQVIAAYNLKAIDIDIEGGAYVNSTTTQRTIDALKLVKASMPSLAVYVTIPSDRSGPDAGMINRAADAGLAVDAWTIMPFDFGAAGQDMGALTIQAAEGLKNTLKNAYGYSDDQAYRHTGISSMNGRTDVGEIVTLQNLTTVLSYVRQHHLARFTFWSVNRDRPCAGGAGIDACSGVDQKPWDYTRVVAAYTG